MLCVPFPRPSHLPRHHIVQGHHRFALLRSVSLLKGFSPWLRSSAFGVCLPALEKAFFAAKHVVGMSLVTAFSLEIGCPLLHPQPPPFDVNRQALAVLRRLRNGVSTSPQGEADQEGSRVRVSPVPFPGKRISLNLS